jgi:2-C-methyl-D-erythritol 4-phosphate cytidylyltransferase
VSKVFALIVAAGEGRRFGVPKQFALLGGRPLIEWPLEKFDRHPEVDEIVLVLPDPEDRAGLRARFRKIAAIVGGGPRRQDSVWNGFLEVRALSGDIVLVHDGARPLPESGLISRVIEASSRSGAAVPVLALDDTVKEVRDGAVFRTLDRERLFRAQTPQGFLYEILKEALESARAADFAGTDEAMLVERSGKRVAAIPGDLRNIKVTVPGDLKIAEAFLEA